VVDGGRAHQATRSVDPAKSATNPKKHEYGAAAHAPWGDPVVMDTRQSIDTARTEVAVRSANSRLIYSRRAGPLIG
jgi:hypothetical protein